MNESGDSWNDRSSAGIGAGRQVRQQHARRTGGDGILDEALHAVAQHRVQVAEQHDGHVAVLRGTRAAPPASTVSSVTPCSSAAWDDRWIVGPSATGSLNGTPSSMMSAPASASATSSGTVRSGAG
jgi:hypothetical protein